jgi:hypothetical protein
MQSITIRINTVFNDRQKPKKPSTPPAIKYARQFLQHLPEIRAEVEMWHSLDWFEVDGTRHIQDQDKFDHAELTLTAINRAERYVGEVVDNLRLRQWTPQEPEPWIANKVAEEWLRTDPTVPLGVGSPDSPLCQFVTSALTKIGIDKKRATVAEALRGRRHRPRNGKN